MLLYPCRLLRVSLYVSLCIDGKRDDILLEDTYHHGMNATYIHIRTRGVGFSGSDGWNRIGFSTELQCGTNVLK